MAILFFDTETTGLPDFKQPSDAPQQPHIVQFAALLIDETTRKEIDSANVLVAPDGWTIPDDVAAIHGITTEQALAEGAPESLVTGLYLGLSARATMRIGHNVSFDLRIMRIALLRAGFTPEQVETNETLPKFCTMSAASSITKMPATDKMRAAGFTKPKPPKLSECIQHFFGEDLAGAHDALNDVRATARLYFHLMDLKEAA